MKAPVAGILSIVMTGLIGVSGAVEESRPRRVSLAPGNDLSVLKFAGRPGGGYGSAVCGAETSEAYRTGHAIGSRNDHFGQRDFLVIDDGKSRFPATHGETGLPMIVLIDVKLTREVEEMVRGYNAAMVGAWQQRELLVRRSAGP